ncbi:16S rRNA (guanine(966)-N(2))-methyltransferase RsmD [Psittacicella hinzii]|uniref:Ribosomal RNA small subunit methyltransferase D n=1 Tax=Psittacicella hinzii TaxID=2028575 RepID=A0A3A1YDS4_9GAMM|nr:16S rRNA (guanine(966)-N(2))-methyltransferase RsmD [Psittacicella hinzii]RIY35691.1 16S rRNA (guanine(966)-N(2))-methyltransferase RsmD [Psittacicella hinzii]
MVKKQSTLHQHANNKGYIYIHAGALKGKKLEVITAEGLRPIGSRVKETFFNWIQFDVAQRRVLDLFAGSGALGFEALSRGCQSLQMCEYAKAVYDRLILNYREINRQALVNSYGFEPQVNIKLTDSYQWVKQKATTTYDLVFVDPPFMQEHELEVLADLAQNGYLDHQALIFLQLDGAYAHLVQQLDQRFTVLKQKAIGNVLIYLLQYNDQHSQTQANSEIDYIII